MSGFILVFLDDDRYISLIVDQFIDARKVCRCKGRLGRPRADVGTVARRPELGSKIVTV
jgi:hypothetical protein